ncbi:fibroblast growth factor receptor substrate 2-like [Pelobates fuscus]|uniref:fibroblast growth factor receptor substrate 2-like n=1 Tax=Pelobates fuscus TaxID=191477 RepID=UPI002FE49608
MGLCLGSKIKFCDTDNAEKRFKVINVNDDGKKICPGVMELTDTSLDFHLEKGGFVKWPFVSLLKYGYDSNLFSFVCGKRCQTGEGIFGFSCSRAEELFHMLKSSMQKNRISIISDTDWESHTYDEHGLPYRYKSCTFYPSSSPVIPISKRPEPVGSERPHDFDGISTHTSEQFYTPTSSKGDRGRHRYPKTLDRNTLDTGISQTSSTHSYYEVPMEYPEPRNYQKPLFALKNQMERETGHLECIDYDVDEHKLSSCIRRMGYENISALHSEGSRSIISDVSSSDSQTTNCVSTLSAVGSESRPSSPSVSEEKHSLELKVSSATEINIFRSSYLNRLSLGQNSENCTATYFNFDITSHPHEMTKLNYIDVESSCDSDNPQTPVSPDPFFQGATSLRCKPYAELDLEKTVALSRIQNQRLTDDGTRKTRHNCKHLPA